MRFIIAPGFSGSSCLGRSAGRSSGTQQAARLEGHLPAIGATGSAEGRPCHLIHSEFLNYRKKKKEEEEGSPPPKHSHTHRETAHRRQLRPPYRFKERLHSPDVHSIERSPQQACLFHPTSPQQQQQHKSQDVKSENPPGLACPPHPLPLSLHGRSHRAR